MSTNISRKVFVLLLISSIILFSAGCDSSPGRGTLEETHSKKSNTVQNMAQDVSTFKNYNPTKRIELSDYLLGNIDLVHDELGGTRYDSSGVISYMISEPGNIYVDYANRADQGMYVLHINIGYSGDYRAGNSMYRLFGCALGDTSTDVYYKLMDYGFQTISSDGVWNHLKIYDGEWTLSYKCDNGFLSWMSVECTKRTARDAFQKSQESGYFVAALTGHSSKTAYIDKISVANNNASIAFSGVFQKGSSENSNRQMTAYMTFTVFPNEKTVYVGYDEYGIIYYSKEEFIKIIKKFNGLGLALTVKNGTLLKAELMS